MGSACCRSATPAQQGGKRYDLHCYPDSFRSRLEGSVDSRSVECIRRTACRVEYAPRNVRRTATGIDASREVVRLAQLWSTMSAIRIPLDCRYY